MLSKSGSSEYKLVISTKNEKNCQISFCDSVDVDKNEEIIIESAIEQETGEELKVNKNITVTLKLILIQKSLK